MIYNSDVLARDFTFTIYRSNPSGTHVELIGALTEAFSAIKAYEMLLICNNPPDIITLRNGARVMREETASGGFREWMKSRNGPTQPALDTSTTGR